MECILRTHKEGKDNFLVFLNEAGLMEDRERFLDQVKATSWGDIARRRSSSSQQLMMA